MLFCMYFSGETPSYSKGTKILFPVTDRLDEGEWCAQVESSNGDMVVLNVQSSCNCPIGYYTVRVNTKVKGDEDSGELRYVHPGRIYILFNPWCEDDAVYMEDEREKEEYILNETGCLFFGNYKHPRRRPWDFGQFDEKCFEAAIYLLQDCPKPVADSERNNPVVVARKMSAAVNAQDDEGVLAGNWSGNYEDGRKPTSWSGSIAILEQYMENRESVKYGQCWVFSGILTTILRSLGIPTRSVTNFASAHDTDGSMTIDKHVDEDGEPVKEMDRDSIWNYHVWNDCWMARPDLPAGYGGWQAVDATPQEKSNGKKTTKVHHIK